MSYAMIKRSGIAVLAIALAVTGDRAFAQQQGEPANVTTTELNAILHNWVTNSSQIKTLSAKFKRIDRRPFHAATEYDYEIRWKSSGLASIRIEQMGRNALPSLMRGSFGRGVKSGNTAFPKRRSPSGRVRTSATTRFSGFGFEAPAGADSPETSLIPSSSPWETPRCSNP